MSYGKSLNDIMAELPESRQQRIQARANELIAEYVTLQEVRKKAGLTQQRVSEALSMPPGNVSRLEHSSDMLLSTLRSYVEAVGGKLSLTVELPDSPTVQLTGLGDLLDRPDERPVS